MCVGDGANGKDFIRTRFVDTGVMLSSQKNLLVAGQRLIERAHA